MLNNIFFSLGGTLSSDLYKLLAAYALTGIKKTKLITYNLLRLTCVSAVFQLIYLFPFSE